MANSKDDQILEVASELRSTLQGDFLEFRRKFIQKLSCKEIPSQAVFELKTLTPIYADADVETGHRLEMKISIPVSTVLAGRNVDPQNMVDTFSTVSGPSKSVELINVEGTGLCFRLTQILMIEKPTYGDHKELIFKRKEWNC
jgi:hypothetical protein